MLAGGVGGCGFTTESSPASKSIFLPFDVLPPVIGRPEVLDGVLAEPNAGTADDDGPTAVMDGAGEVIKPRVPGMDGEGA